MTDKALQVALSPLRTDLAVLKWMAGFHLALAAAILLKLLM